MPDEQPKKSRVRINLIGKRRPSGPPPDEPPGPPAETTAPKPKSRVRKNLRRRTK